MQNLLDTHGDFHVFCYGNGVKLIRPEKAYKQTCTSFFYDTGYTVSTVLQLPINVTFLNVEANTCTINELSAATSGFISTQDAIGKSIADVTKAASGRIVMAHNHAVMSQAKKYIFEETILRKDNSSANVLSVKSPWYDDNNKVVGLFGCGLQLGRLPLAESLALISRVGMLANHIVSAEKKADFFKSQFGDVYLTKREIEILHYVVRGKTAKNIGAALMLSPRTVEAYMASLKIKLKAQNKSELIEKIFERVFVTPLSN